MGTYNSAGYRKCDLCWRWLTVQGWNGQGFRCPTCGTMQQELIDEHTRFHQSLIKDKDNGTTDSHPEDESNA